MNIVNFINSSKKYLMMLRRVLERQGAAAEAALNNSPSTPLRSHWSGLNPTRLIDKHMTSVSFIILINIIDD